MLAAGFQDFNVVFFNMTNLNQTKILTGHSALPGVLYQRKIIYQGLSK